MSSALKEKWTEFIQSFEPFDWFVTLTFQYSPSEKKATQLHNRFIRLLNEYIYGRRYRENKCGVIYISSREYQKRGTIHFHLLIKNIPYWVDKNLFKTVWESPAFDNTGSTGFARIYDYNKNLGASGYLAKYCSKSNHVEVYNPPKIKEPIMFFDDLEAHKNSIQSKYYQLFSMPGKRMKSVDYNGIRLLSTSEIEQIKSEYSNAH